MLHQHDVAAAEAVLRQRRAACRQRHTVVPRLHAPAGRRTRPPCLTSRHSRAHPQRLALGEHVQNVGSVSAGAGRSHAAISRPPCFAPRSARFAVTATPASRPSSDSGDSTKMSHTRRRET